MRLALLAGIVFIASIPIVPTLTIQPRDSGIFAYFGAELTHGATPYKDVFDHKPPVIFLVNALAFVLFGPSRWAIWWISLLNMIAVSAAFFALARRVTEQRGMAWLGTIFLILIARHPALIHDGNFTEPFALLPHVIGFLVGYAFLQRPNFPAAFLIGVCAGLTFMTRQNTIGLAVALLPALWLTRHPWFKSTGWYWHVFAMIAGGLSVLGVVALGLLACGAGQAGYEGIWSFNQTYLDVNQAPLLRTVYDGLTNFYVIRVVVPILPIAGWGMLRVVRHVITRWQLDAPAAPDTNMAQTTLRTWIALSFAINLVLANISNRAYEHYYLVVLPELVLLILIVLASPLMRRRNRRDNQLRFAVGVYVGTMVIISFALGTLPAVLSAENPLFGKPIIHPVAEYIKANTEAGDWVYVWRRSGDINFQARRRNPVRHYMAFHLMYRDYAAGAVIDELVADLRARRPVMVVDMAEEDILPPLDRGGGDPAVWVVDYLDPLYTFVADHCTPIERIETAVIYRCDYTDP